MKGYAGVQRLAEEHPNWLPIVEASLRCVKTGSGEFAGTWVLKEAKKMGRGWFPNLRILVSYGILERTDIARGGRRAYYTMPDQEGVAKALRELGYI